MIFLLLSSVICVCAAFRERSKGKHPLGLSAPRGGRKKTEHAEPCPTCPEEMIAGLRVLFGEFRAYKRRRREIIGAAVRLQSNAPARGRFRRTPSRRGTYRSLVRRTKHVSSQAGLLTQLHRPGPFSVLRSMVMASAPLHSSGPVGDLRSVPYSPSRLHGRSARTRGHL